MQFLKKWLVRFLIALVFIIALVAASDNSQPVTLAFLGYETFEWPVSWWMLTAFVTGILVGIALNFVSNTRLRMDARRSSKQATQANRALDQANAGPASAADPK